MAGEWRRAAVAAALGMGAQPSASSTARRMARLELPPIQMGGRGCWSGPGQRDVSPSATKWRPSKLKDLPRPRRLHGHDGLVGQLVALGEVHPEGGELDLLVAGADAQDDPAAGQDVEGGRRLGREEGVLVGEDGQVGLEPNGGGGGGGEGQGDERVEGVVAAGAHPGVTRDRVLGDEDGVEAGGLGAAGHLGHRRTGDELLGQVDPLRRQPQRDLHGVPPTPAPARAPPAPLSAGGARARRQRPVSAAVPDNECLGCSVLTREPTSGQ